MAQIPDFTSLGPSPIPTPSYRRPYEDNSAAGVDQALAGLGQTLEQVGNQQHARDVNLARAQSNNAFLDHKIAVETLRQNVQDQVATGELPYQQARDVFDQQAAKIRTPQIENLDEIGQMQFERGVKDNVFVNQQKLDSTVELARKNDFKDQFVGGLDRLGKLAGQPGADVAAINSNADTYRPFGREAGIPRLGCRAPAGAGRMQLLTSLHTAFNNDDAYQAAMRQIAPHSPLTAMAGTMLGRPSTPWFDPKFATDPIAPVRILEGEQILREKDEKGIASKFPMPTDKDLMPQFMAAVGGANSDLFRGRPETLETSFAAFKAYYAAEANHRGVANGVINQSIAAQAAHGVIGNSTQYGNTNLVVPAGMDPLRFEGTVNATSQSALRAGGYSEKDIEALRGYGLRELGDTLGTGRYVIIDGNVNPARGRIYQVYLFPGDPLKSKTGRNSVIIDLNKARSQRASVFNSGDPRIPEGYGYGPGVPVTEPEGP